MTQLVLFDAVGTLFSVRGSVGKIYSDFAANYGVSLPPSAIDQRFGSVFAKRLAPTANSRQWWYETVQETFAGLSFTDFDSFFAQVYDYFATGDAWFLYPETREVLEELKQRGLTLAIVSNFDDRLYTVLEALAVRDFFAEIGISAAVGHAKPSPLLFAHVLEKLKISADHALHIGDSVEDVIGAKAAGIKVLRVDRRPQPQAQTVPNLKAIFDWL
ncbi:MAG: HAD-IA family hydrolase [Anaerolineae bacterium]|nr:HAD-IA family hydrolase [Gloeobacterales cyanobacterium ES-bin-313]